MDYREKYYFCKKLLIITIILFTVTIIAYVYNIKLKVPLIPKPVYIADTVKIEEFSEANLIKYMELLNIEHANIVLNQAKLESGNFTSNRFKKYNALFGFQISETNVIKYKSWKESVIHYKCMQMRKLKPNEDYYTFLIRIHYAADSSYINKLKQFKNA